MWPQVALLIVHSVCQWVSLNVDPKAKHLALN